MASGNIKGITVEIGADTTKLGKALRDVNSESIGLQKELKQVEKLLKFDPGNTELIAQKQQILAQNVDATSKKLETLRKVQAQVDSQFAKGDIGAEQYRAFQREIADTEQSLNGLKKKLESIDSTEKNVTKLSDSFNKVEKSASSAGVTIAKSLGAAAIAGGVAIGGLVSNMQELNSDLAKLKTNASSAGFDLAGVEEGFRKIAAVSGETDSAVETMSNLMATDFSDNQLAQVIDEINGAAIRFSDTLKTEGIADGLQETFATGEAAGQFGELLERSGVSLDTFNAGLAKAKQNGTETDYVLQQLSSLGLASTYEEYKKLNPEVYAQQEAQMKLSMALSNLSIVLTPLVTLVVSFLATVVEWVNKNIELVKSFDSISQGLIALLPQMLDNGIQIITNLIEGIASSIPRVLETAKEIIPKITDKLAEFYPKVIEAGLDITFSLIDGIVQLLPNLLKTAVSLISSIVTTLIKNLPRIIDSGVKILKSLIDGIVKTLPSLLQTALKLVVSVATTIIQNLPKIIDSGVQLLKSLVNGIVKMLPDLISTALKLVLQVVSTIAQNLPKIIESGVKILKSLISGIVSIAASLGKAIVTDIIPQIVDTLIEVDLLQVGKDIIQGLINGIISMGTAVLDSITGVVNGAIDAAKKLLGIHSPSRVFRQIGVWTVQGFANGINETRPTAVKAMQSVGNSIIAVLNNYANQRKALQSELNKDIKKVNSDTEDKIYKIKANAAAKKRKLAADENKKILKLQKEAAAKIETLKKTHSANLIKLEQEEKKAYLETIQSFIDDKKSLEQLSLIDEAFIWEQSIKLFAKGSDERIKAQQKYRDVLEAINDEIVTINEKYQSEMQTINENLAKQEEELTATYTDALSKRYDSLMSFADTFDKFTVEVESSGTDLLNNLQSQVDGFKMWQDEFAKLSSKNIDADLLAEISGLGVKALPELIALNQLTEEQLTQYSALYKEKSKLAREQAETELAGMKEDVTKQIEELRKKANEQLSNLQFEWQNAIVSITTTTSTELSTLEQIGMDAGQGLLDGLSSMEGSLIEKAEQIANAIRQTIQSALDIHSPSRVMRGFGVNIGEGLIIGMDEMINKVSQSSARLANAVSNVHSSLSNSRMKTQSINRSNFPYSNNIDKSRNFQPTVNIYTNDPGDKAMNRTLRRLAFEF